MIDIPDRITDSVEYKIGYKKGKEDVLFELISKDLWNEQQRMVIEDWFEQLKEKNK